MKNQKTDTLTVHVNISREVLEMYEKMYPHSRRRFIENAFRKASEDRNFFDSIFFMDLLKNT